MLFRQSTIREIYEEERIEAIKRHIEGEKPPSVATKKIVASGDESNGEVMAAPPPNLPC